MEMLPTWVLLSLSACSWKLPVIENLFTTIDDIFLMKINCCVASTFI